ncbi:uncharacterized protein [Antedon mediterranea]|uniref:uncharacterized protein n=1 Tax=Antedon mediterranea TaxID=105859 RepID=UPI003AF7A679
MESRIRHYMLREGVRQETIDALQDKSLNSVAQINKTSDETLLTTYGLKSIEIENIRRGVEMFELHHKKETIMESRIRHYMLREGVRQETIDALQDEKLNSVAQINKTSDQTLLKTYGLKSNEIENIRRGVEMFELHHKEETEDIKPESIKTVVSNPTWDPTFQEATSSRETEVMVLDLKLRFSKILTKIKTVRSLQSYSKSAI